MPFYEYECQSCKYYTEIMQKITDAPLKRCPSCGQRSLQKLVSAPVFRLKGSGWYETDFKSDKESKRNLVGAEKEEAGSEAKPDVKVAGKGEGKDAKPEAAKAPEKAKPAEPAAGRSRTARRTAAAPRKTARAAAPRRTGRPAAGKRAPKRRR